MCETVIENDSPGKYGLLSLSHRGGLNSSAVCPPVCKIIVDKAVFCCCFLKPWAHITNMTQKEFSKMTKGDK